MLILHGGPLDGTYIEVSETCGWEIVCHVLGDWHPTEFVDTHRMCDNRECLFLGHYIFEAHYTPEGEFKP